MQFFVSQYLISWHGEVSATCEYLFLQMAVSFLEKDTISVSMVRSPLTAVHPFLPDPLDPTFSEGRNTSV